MDERLAEKILSLSGDLKADAAEVFIRASSSTTIEVKDQKVDAFERSRDIGAGLRVLINGRTGFSYTTDTSEPSLRELARSAVGSARNTEPDPFATIPRRPAVSYPTVDIFDPVLAALTEQEQISRAMAMEREAYRVDQRIRRMRKAAVVFRQAETLIANSFGASVSYRGTAASASIEVVAEENGDSQAGWEYEVKRFYDRLNIEQVGRQAARKALDLLGARSIRSEKAQVILEAGVAQEVLAVLASGFSAEHVQKRKSLFVGKLGTFVASPLITVSDDGLMHGGMGSAPSDDELVPSRRKTVIDQGRLALFLHNARTAKKDKTESTGNAVRSGFKGVPGVGVTNLYIEPGALSPEDLIAGTGRGLYVTEIMGAHTANSISGDFSVGATGFWIEGGQKAYPVREITIAGNVLDLMKNVDAVGSDLRFTGRIGSPSLRVKELSISGK